MEEDVTQCLHTNMISSSPVCAPSTMPLGNSLVPLAEIYQERGKQMWDNFFEKTISRLLLVSSFNQIKSMESPNFFKLTKPINNTQEH